MCALGIEEEGLSTSLGEGVCQPHHMWLPNGLK